jgi:hypothetical protein
VVATCSAGRSRIRDERTCAHRCCVSDLSEMLDRAWLMLHIADGRSPARWARVGARRVFARQLSF